jgi:AmiR/NasT family two-component response regulator
VYHNRIAARHRRFERRYGRTDVIHDATSLLMARFDIDAGQAVAHLVKVSKRHSESIEAAARMCVDAELRGGRLAA